MTSNALHRQPPALQHKRSQASRRVARPRRCRACTQPHTVGVAAFKAADESISISVDGYNLLQVNRAASRETCSKKYDHLVNSPPQVGYTQETLYSRAIVLKSATEAVMDMTATPSYRQQPGQMSLALMYSNLPGALALLQEAGETQTVLDWGNAWLRDSASDSKTRDVALSMALTYCDTAAMLLEEDPDNALLAVEAMNAALKLLKVHGSNQQLEVDITGAMKELAPKVALQQLSLPMDDSRRDSGLATLRSFVWEADSSNLKRPRMDYMQDVRDQMTAQEQIELYEAQPSGISTPGEDLYDTAIAYIAEGFSSHKPQHIRTAHRLLSQVAQQHQTGSDLDVSVELAVCCLLLGDSNQAEDALRLGPNSAPNEADPAVRSFVMDACAGSDDLLPGLCALAQQWLRDVALPGFRAMSQQTLSLTDWYNDRGVSLYLQVLDNGRRLHLDNAASTAKHYLSGFFNNMRSAVTKPFAADQQSVRSDHCSSAPASSIMPQQSVKPEKAVQPTPSMASNARQERPSPRASALSDTAQHQASNGAQHSMPSRTSNARPDRANHRAAALSGTAQDQTAADAQHSMHSRAASEQEAEPNRAERVRPGEDNARTAQAQLLETDHVYHMASGGVEGSHAIASRLQPSDTTALPDEAMSPLSRPTSARPRSPGGPRFGGVQTTGPVEGGQRWGITDGIVQFDGEREMWASYQDSDLRAKRRLRAVVAGALLLVAGVAFKYLQHSRAARPVAPAVPVAFSNPMQSTAYQTAGQMTESSAEQLLLQWNQVKAAALGPQHDIDRLSEVLSGKMLTSWQEQAESLQAKERHWEYEVSSLKVLSVEVSEDETAVVLAAVEETAKLYEQAELQHVYKGQYAAEYEMTKDGSDWKLMDSTVTF